MNTISMGQRLDPRGAWLWEARINGDDHHLTDNEFADAVLADDEVRAYVHGQCESLLGYREPELHQPRAQLHAALREAAMDAAARRYVLMRYHGLSQRFEGRADGLTVFRYLHHTK